MRNVNCVSRVIVSMILDAHHWGSPCRFSII